MQKLRHISCLRIIIFSGFFVFIFGMLFIYNHEIRQDTITTLTSYQKISTVLTSYKKNIITLTSNKKRTSYEKTRNDLEKAKNQRKNSDIRVRKNLMEKFPSRKKDVNKVPLDNHINNLCDPTKIFKPHSKILSYTSFGPNPAYSRSIPTIIDFKRNSSFYNDWVIRIYHDGKIAKNILQKIEGEEDVQLCDAHNLPQYGDISSIFGMYWRFVPIADQSVDVFCSRDLDSAIMLREEDAVKEFMESVAVLHTMRDHPYHHIPMLSGMWCFKNKLDRVTGRYYLERILEEARIRVTKEDQQILNKVIWRHAVKKNMTKIMQHDSYNCGRFKNSRPFPKKRRPDDYHVGRPGPWRAIEGIDLKKYVICPVQCRPSYGKDWEYC